MHCSDVVVVSKAAATAKNPNIMMDIRSAVGPDSPLCACECRQRTQNLTKFKPESARKPNSFYSESLRFFAPQLHQEA